IHRYQDGFGNRAHLLTIARAHRSIEVVSRAEVMTFLADPFVPPLAAPRPLGPADLVDYLSPSPLIEQHSELARIAAPHRPRTPADAFESVRALMDFVYSGF